MLTLIHRLVPIREVPACLENPASRTASSFTGYSWWLIPIPGGLLPGPC